MAESYTLSPEQRRLFKIMRGERERRDISSYAISPATRGNHAPLSRAQQRLWIDQQLYPESSVYNLPLSMRIQGDLDYRALQASFDTILHRHSILRTRFGADAEGEPIQIIEEEICQKLCVIDLKTVKEADREAVLSSWIEEEACRPFDLTTGPLIRGSVFQLASSEYVLAIVAHHIVFDGWSIAIFAHELSEVYQASLNGDEPNLVDLPCQYSDYAIWERQQLRSETTAKSIRYWMQVLSGAPTLLRLPNRNSGADVRTFRANYFPISLTHDIARGVHELSREAHATSYMVLLAVFQVLLWRYSGQRDLVVGTPVANRSLRGLEHLIGVFANLIPIRIYINPGLTFAQLLKEVRAVCLGAFEHQHLPFDRLIEELNPERAPNREPLIQVLFGLRPFEPPTFGNQKLFAASVNPVGTASGSFDLSLFLTESADGFRGTLQYSTDLFCPELISRMVSSWFQLLQLVIAHPEVPLSLIPITPPHDHEQILEWNTTERNYPGVESVVDCFEQQAERRPEAEAVRCEGASLSYGELNRRADQLARYLAARGVGPDVPVGIYMERSLEMMIGLLGILKAGGVYVPLEPDQPEERIRYFIEDGALAIVLNQSRLRSVATGSQLAICLDLDTDWEEIAAWSSTQPVIRPQPDNLAYLIYTSGSTGQPKGAMNTHRGLYNRLLWMQEQYHLGPDDAVLQKTASSFDVSMWEFLWPLISGVTLVMARPGGQRDARYLARTIQEERITTAHFVPSMLAQWLDDPEAANCRGLKRVIASGEELPLSLQKRFYEMLPGCELHNLYGPTEASIDVTAWPCDRTQESGPVPIGRPIANTQMYVLDEGMQAVPVGVAGELYIGGPGWRAVISTGPV